MSCPSQTSGLPGKLAASLSAQSLFTHTPSRSPSTRGLAIEVPVVAISAREEPVRVRVHFAVKVEVGSARAVVVLPVADLRIAQEVGGVRVIAIAFALGLTVEVVVRLIDGNDRVAVIVEASHSSGAPDTAQRVPIGAIGAGKATVAVVVRLAVRSKSDVAPEQSLSCPSHASALPSKFAASASSQSPSHSA